MIKNYIIPDKVENKNLFLISLVLSVLFTLFFARFKNTTFNFISNEILIFSFIFILLFTRLIFMKFIGFKLGVEIKIKKYYLNKYFLRPFDKISHIIPILSKGISSYTIAILIYILSLGFLIFPSIWNFSIKKIPHIYIGSKLRFEDTENSIGITKYRYSLILFYGALFYFLFAFIYKFMSVIFNFQFFNNYIFILYWIAIFTTLPIPLTEGWNLYSSNHFAWLSAITILIFSLLILLIFHNLFLVILTTFIAVLVIFITITWRKLMI